MTDAEKIIARELRRLMSHETAAETALDIAEAIDIAGLVIRPKKATDEMAEIGSVAILDAGAPDFPGENTICTMSARIDADEAKVIRAAMVAVEVGA